MWNLNRNWSELKGKKETWLIPLLIGILLVVIAVPIPDRKEEKAASEKNIPIENTYIHSLEQQLEQVLSKVQGVGNVSVMITISSSAEKIVEKDEETSVQSSLDEQGSSSTTDRRETSVYTGISGEESPYVVKEISPQIAGVIVVAEGGDNAIVIEQITDAVQALFGIEPHKIKVMKHN